MGARTLQDAMEGAKTPIPEDPDEVLQYSRNRSGRNKRR